jgi:hypothetical protein
MRFAEVIFKAGMPLMVQAEFRKSGFSQTHIFSNLGTGCAEALPNSVAKTCCSFRKQEQFWGIAIATKL